MSRRALLAAVAALLALGAEPALAHVGSLGGSAASDPLPSWLVVVTGGGVVGASFLFTSFLTDHALIRSVTERGLSLRVRRALATLARRLLAAAGVLALLVVLASGLLGPTEATRNLAILLVWAGWWAGYTMSVYLVGNSWPALNPWRTLARWLPTARLPTVDRPVGEWPAAVGLLALVWVEVVSPVAASPRLLAAVVVGYTAATLAGAALLGPERWFDRVDPVSRVFRCYGLLAPVQRTDDGLELTLPGAALARGGADVSPTFVVALLWATTYDGVVSTPAWAGAVRALAGAGVPPLLAYLAAVAAGFGLFLGAYRLAARAARRTADSYVTARAIERWFAPALLPIAAGYHLAHFLGYLLTLAPALVAVLASPLDPPATVAVAVLPGWFGTLELLFVVVGHLLAVGVAHALAFDLFAGRLQPIRSQYPFVAAMVGYTVVSMWIVAQPYVEPPFV